MKPLDTALDIVGGPAKLASILGVTVQAVCFWRDELRKLPAEHCPLIEQATGGKVRCEQLRPDLAERWTYLRGTSPSSRNRAANHA